MKHKSMILVDSSNLNIKGINKKLSIHEFYSSLTNKHIKEYSTVEEMYLSNIITESEYIQLQERIQILTERSE